MGLYHTFGLEGSCTGPGDFISDTSAHSAPTGGCGADADLSTCPGESSDHSNNFMDYSYDVVSCEVFVVVVIVIVGDPSPVQSNCSGLPIYLWVFFVVDI